jgi:splicing factor 3B subunit 1
MSEEQAKRENDPSMSSNNLDNSREDRNQTKKKRRWDDSSETPINNSDQIENVSRKWEATPLSDTNTLNLAKNRWDETPRKDPIPVGDSSKKRSRWDETPIPNGNGPASRFQTPGATPLLGSSIGMMTPLASNFNMTPEIMQQMRWEAEVDERNRYLTDAELDALFPPGYKILEPPLNYVPIRTPSRKISSTPTPQQGTPGFSILPTPARDSYGIPATPSETALPFIKPEDYQYFGKLLDDSLDEENLPEEDQKERKIMRLLLKIKNGTPPQRKTALRQMTEKAKEFGAETLFNQILPLLMAPTLEDQVE